VVIGECFDDIAFVFSDRQNYGPNISEDLRTLEGAESPRDLHAQLHHTHVPVGLIVGEGNCEVRKEPQGFCRKF
jgi:hypothetical protein